MKRTNGLFGRGDANEEVIKKVGELGVAFAQLGAAVSKLQNEDRKFQALLTDCLDKSNDCLKQVGNSVYAGSDRSGR